MKILWVTNQLLPDIAIEMNQKISNSGGWMIALSKSIANDPNIELTICSVLNISKIYSKKINEIDYIILKSKGQIHNYDNNLEQQWQQVIDKVKPDIIHIHGTEYSYGLTLLNICPNNLYVISIQGLISKCSQYYYRGMSRKEIIFNLTFRDIFRSDNIFQAKAKFSNRGKNELEYLKKVKNVIGRTQWDMANTWEINQSRKYYFCNETLRNKFYSANKWNSKKIEKYSIFLSQGYYPLKGLHQLIKALPLIKKQFPNVIINIAGGNIIKRDTFIDKLKLSGYGKFIYKLIKKNDLSENIKFVGILNTGQMIEQYLKSHIFVCPSSIENSSNSIGESQILGVPTIASFVGGNMDMVEHNSTGVLYQFDAVEMLAHHIIKLFSDMELCEKLSKQAVLVAENRHSLSINSKRLVNIYGALLQ